MYRKFNPRKNTRGKYAHKSLPNRELIEAIRSVDVIQKGKTSEISEEPVLVSSFTDFRLSEKLLENISFKKYVLPTPIQVRVIPAVLADRDVIGIANTGTGKTAAFLIPLAEKVFQAKSEKILIVAPTRELALQIQEELHGFARGLGILSVLCIGGMSIGRQKNELRLNPQFVIGTPGRIKDLIGERALVLTGFNRVVLDEADRMVDIGFIQDIKYFISLLPQNRQSLFFSATISSKVKDILSAFVHNPVTVSVKQQETPMGIEQDVIRVEKGYSKIDKLHDLLTEDGFDKVLIFGRTKWGVQKLANELIRRGFKAGAIHGNKNQNQRQKVLEQFKRGEIKVLLATDVASRGLDIPDVTHVINYDMPADLENYVHRIGRTGRAEKKGKALTFIE
jgi:superfamily II DNA/RNA helicase